MAAFEGPAEAHLIGCAPTGTGECVADMPGPAPGEQFTELSSGVFTYSKTDLSLPGPMPINVTRVYRSSDKVAGSGWNARAFGLGTSLNYDLFLYSFSEAQNGTYTDANLVLPDGGMVRCVRKDTGPAADYVNAVFACNQQPSGVWFGSTISYSGGGWDLRRPDGTVYHFGDNSPLQSITDRFNNRITVTRGGPKAAACVKPVPATAISQIRSSNGRSVSFCYDDNDYPNGISSVIDDLGGRRIDYTYGGSRQLQTVTQTTYNSHATTTYQYNQTSPSGIGNITTIIVNDACGGTNCGTPKQFFTYITYVSNALGTAVKSISSQLPGNGYRYAYTIPNGWASAQQVTVTLPDDSKRTFDFDQSGYVLKDSRNVGVAGTLPEYTVFTRGMQVIGATGNAQGTAEFIGKVQEQDSNQSTVRQTTYTYDAATGNVTRVTLSPKPGDSSPCCATSASWSYTYTTFNRLQSAVEPLAYNGIGTRYAYNDTPSQPTMTVTDPLGRSTLVTFNPQGQPVSVRDPMGHVSSTVYNSYGDVQRVQDPMGNITQYQADPDGRVIQVTSPMNEVTRYAYDALDNVTDVYVDPSGLNLHSHYTYDLLGQLAGYTTPRGFTTTIDRNAALTKTTVTDPLGRQTVTNVDGMGGVTDYTDKRNIKTTYVYDAYGRIAAVNFNSNQTPGYPAFAVTVGINGTTGAYDALDRPQNVFLFTGSGTNFRYRGPGFTYDSMDNILTESGFDSSAPQAPPYYKLTYQYDSNGRRVSVAPVLGSVTFPTIRYAYDCADELVAIANDGSSPVSCGPTVNVTNGDPSSQVAFNYDPDGNPNWTLVDAVKTTFLRDLNERVTSQTFQSYPGGTTYGDLTYVYDADGRIIGKGGFFGTVEAPANETATYNQADQMTVWNGFSTTLDAAGNLKTDPSTGLSFTWNAANQLVAMSGGITEAYDALGRRESSAGGGHTLTFLHDGPTILGLTDAPSNNRWTFLPGALAGSWTSGATTTTWVPLRDIAGSTIALVKPGQTDSHPPTLYSYDPFGVPRLTGAGSFWPFLYQGMEHEITDPAPLYFDQDANVYNPMLQRELSQLGQQGIAGPPAAGAADGGMGNGFGGFGPSQSFGNPGGLSGGRIASNLLTVASAYSTVGSGIGLGFGGESPISLPFFGGSLGDIFDLFEGGHDPEIPRQKRHKRHPVYQNIIGTQVVSQTSAAPIAHIRYRTMDDAAIAVFDAAIARQAATGKEVYGGIYGTPSSGYFATTPRVGESATGATAAFPIPPDAIYHTHPDDSLHSAEDIFAAREHRLPSYVFVPSGHIYKYDPEANSVSEVARRIPRPCE